VPTYPTIPACEKADALDLAFPVEFHHASAQDLAPPPPPFDAVVTSFVLCSHKDPLPLLRRLGHFLHPHGELRLLEHGLTDHPVAGRLLHWLSPHAARRGENIMHDIPRLVREAGYDIRKIRRRAWGTVVEIRAVRGGRPSPGR